MKLKRILGLLTVFAGVGVFSVCAYAGQITVTGSSAEAGGKVDVNVSIAPNEEGVAETLNGFIVNITYDSDVLTPQVMGEDDLGEDLYAAMSDAINGGVIVAAPTDDGTLAVAWAMGEAIEYSSSMDLFTVTFAVDSDATGSTAVGIEVSQLAADSSTLVTDTQTFDGTVVIGGETTFIRGDANGDDDVDIKDSALISDYVNGLSTIDSAYIGQADANADNEVDIKDSALISDYVNGLATIAG